MADERAGTRLWRGSAQSSRDDERRRRLLVAALDVYGTTGYRSASVGSVCRLAHVSTRSFYELYADQSELLMQLYRGLNAEVLDGFANAPVDPALPVRQTVRALVAAALMPMLDDERKARVLEVESAGVSAALERERRSAYRAFAAAIDAAFSALQRAGRVEAVPGGLASLILVGGITEALVQRVQTPPVDRTDSATFIEDVTDVIVRVIRPRPESSKS